MGHIVDYNLTEELEHGIYVSLLVRDLSRELLLSEEAVREMQIAGLLHDIGKLRLTNYLYGNERPESPLVIEEMKYVRMHPMLSYDILNERGYSGLICESVRYHHEDYDGSGYPSNLVGDEIPLGARIIRVCDVYAALTTDRPYRKRFSQEEAISLMIDEIRHFDMRIFLHFMNVANRTGTSYKIRLADSDYDLIRRYEIPAPEELKEAFLRLEPGT